MAEENLGLVEKEVEGKVKGVLFDTLKGIIAAFGIVLLWATSATAVQLVERRIPDMELNTFRCATPFLACGTLTLISREWPLVQKEEIGATVLYTVDIFVSALFYFVAISLFPAALVACITYTSSVVSALFIFSLCWNEKITMRNVMFALISVLGVVMVIQLWQPNSDNMEVTNVTLNVQNGSHPLLLDDLSVQGDQVIKLGKPADIGKEEGNYTVVSSAFKETEDTESDASILHSIIGYTFSVIAGICLSLELLIIKLNPFLGDRHLFWAFLTNTLLSAALMLALETPVLPNNWFDATMVTIYSAECAVLWRLYLYAPKYISGNTLTIILTSDVVVMLIFQYTVLSSIHPGHRNWIEVAGVFLVLLGCSMASLLELLNTKKSET